MRTLLIELNQNRSWSKIQKKVGIWQIKTKLSSERSTASVSSILHCQRWRRKKNFINFFKDATENSTDFPVQPVTVTHHSCYSCFYDSSLQADVGDLINKYLFNK